MGASVRDALVGLAVSSSSAAVCFAEMPLAKTVFFLSSCTAKVAPASDRVYTVTVTASSNTTYTLTAAPQLTQASKDTKCASLTLTNTGQKGNSAGGSECW